MPPVRRQPTHQCRRNDNGRTSSSHGPHRSPPCRSGASVSADPIRGKAEGSFPGPEAAPQEAPASLNGRGMFVMEGCGVVTTAHESMLAALTVGLPGMAAAPRGGSKTDPGCGEPCTAPGLTQGNNSSREETSGSPSPATPETELTTLNRVLHFIHAGRKTPQRTRPERRRKP